MYFFCAVYFPIDERSKYKIGPPFLFTICSLQNGADKPLRINWPLNYKCRNLNRKVQCVSFVCLFVCFSCFRFKCSLFFDRRQVRSVLGLERRQTCALDPRFNSKSNCTQGNRGTSIGLHKNGIFRNVSKQQRWRSLSKRGGGGRGSSKGLLYKDPSKGETAVHGCHCPNLTTALLPQLGERRSAERVVR